MRIFSILFFILVVSACATKRSKEAIVLRENDAKGVESCKFLKTLNGSSDWGGLAAQGIGYENAKTEVFEEAAAAGATDIVWLNQSKGFGGSSLAANAYRCH